MFSRHRKRKIKLALSEKTKLVNEVIWIRDASNKISYLRIGCRCIKENLYYSQYKKEINVSNEIDNVIGGPALKHEMFASVVIKVS